MNKLLLCVLCLLAVFAVVAPCFADTVNGVLASPRLTNRGPIEGHEHCRAEIDGHDLRG